MQTADELAQYAQDKRELEENLRHAQAAADPIRYGLLYGSGRHLVATVAAVFDAARLTTVDLDEVFGTKSADLLVRPVGRRRLIEVEAATRVHAPGCRRPPSVAGAAATGTAARQHDSHDDGSDQDGSDDYPHDGSSSRYGDHAAFRISST